MNRQRASRTTGRGDEVFRRTKIRSSAHSLLFLSLKAVSLVVLRKTNVVPPRTQYSLTWPYALRLSMRWFVFSYDSLSGFSSQHARRSPLNQQLSSCLLLLLSLLIPLPDSVSLNGVAAWGHNHVLLSDTEREAVYLMGVD
ncbi:hypothetical protein VTK56DRAFT_1613 [Thermocarpiscus australiensis]